MAVNDYTVKNPFTEEGRRAEEGRGRGDKRRKHWEMAERGKDKRGGREEVEEY